MESKKAPGSAQALPSLLSRIGEEQYSSGPTVGVGPMISGGAEQAVGCGVSAVVQEAPGESDQHRAPEQAGSWVVSTAPSPQTRLTDPSLHVA